MYIIKNALTSITRNKGRNILICIIVVVIAASAAVSLAIRNSATELIESYENQYEVEATIGVNRTSMKNEMRGKNSEDDKNISDVMENIQDIFSEVSSLTIDEITEYADSDYVKSYYYELSVGVDADDIDAASSTIETSNNGENDFGGKVGKQDFTVSTISSSGDFTLIGYSNLEAMSDFISGTYSISEGEITDDFFTEYYAVINSELASLNDIEVGDEITLIDPNDDDNTITLTVVGIFDETSETNEGMSMYTSSVNTILTNAGVVSEFAGEDDDLTLTVTPTFILTSSDVIEDFEKELTEKGLSEYLSVSTNLDEVESATSTISNVKTFATTFLIITLIIGAVVLFTINMINIRERKYEIGVLRTIGMKKSLLTTQFMFELLVVTMVGLIVGAGIGAVASVPVSNMLLENEISSSESSQEEINNNFGGGMEGKFENISSVTSVQAFDSIDAVVDFVVLLELFAIGIVLTLISSLAAMISIQKFSPLAILKERS